MRKKTILAVSLGALAVCVLFGAIEIAANPELDPAANRGAGYIRINAYVRAVLDREHGNICYYRNDNGGISCLPLAGGAR